MFMTNRYSRQPINTSCTLHQMIKTLLHTLPLALLLAQGTSAGDRQLYFGDTHLHTSYSFDAYLNKNQSGDPDLAYRWAKGQPVLHPLNRTRVQIGTPLDFLAVTDHAELMGVIRAINRDEAELEDLGWWGNLRRWLAVYLLNDAIEEGAGSDFFVSLLPVPQTVEGGDPVRDPANVLPNNTFGDTTAIETGAWSDIVDAAEQHNEPGIFTTLIGWEWSSIPVGANLHRIVFTPDGADKAKQFLPYGSDQSQSPEDLWTFLEETNEATGARFIAMPHNSNISRGYMYDETNLKGDPITAAYAERRMRWEPISEITQFKGDSETHPDLSPGDEFADYETYGHYIQQVASPYEAAPGDYMRSAFKRGLKLEASVGVNPYQFGIIGSTDSHSGLASAEEDNFWGKFARDNRPETKRTEDRIGRRGATGWSMQAGALAAVWAEDNTREAIFEAFQRRETYATTGPRLKVRVFGGWNFPEGLEAQADYAAKGYTLGVPMGNALPAPVDDATAPPTARPLPMS